MGNYISCTLATPLIKTHKASRVVLPTGEIRQFRQPVKAAEFMFECPNYFLANSQSLHIGRRFSALSADEELELGNVYIMFPMKKVNSIVTAADMAIFFMAANSAAKRIGGGKGKITPENNGSNEEEAEKEESQDERPGLLDEAFPEIKYRLSVCRSRKPMLETINEEQVCSR
ncbi:hypothetical protein ACFE04_019172 [Oxalis oulophora]